MADALMCKCTREMQQVSLIITSEIVVWWCSYCGRVLVADTLEGDLQEPDKWYEPELALGSE